MQANRNIKLYKTGVDFSFRNNFANLGSFVKVSFPVEIYNSYGQPKSFPLVMLSQILNHANDLEN